MKSQKRVEVVFPPGLVLPSASAPALKLPQLNLQSNLRQNVNE